MIQRRRCPCFSPEPFQRLRIAGEIVGQEFQRDEAPQLSVFCLVHHPHAAAAEFLDDSVVRDGLTDELGGASHWREW